MRDGENRYMGSESSELYELVLGAFLLITGVFFSIFFQAIWTLDRWKQLFDVLLNFRFVFLGLFSPSQFLLSVFTILLLFAGIVFSTRSVYRHFWHTSVEKG